MLPRLADRFQPAHSVGRKASFTGRGSIQNQVAVSSIQRVKPLVHNGRHGLEMSIRVSLFPEPTIREGHPRKARPVTVHRALLSAFLLKRLHIGIVDPAPTILTPFKVSNQP